MIGPNGAGKTSLFNVISRVYQPASGSVTFDGRNLLRLRTYQTARAGIARTFQNLGQFPHTTVLDYLLLGRHTRMRSGIVIGGVYVGPTRREEVKNRAYCSHLMQLLGLQSVAKMPLGLFPYGVQKRADLARALAPQPKLLLLDKPVAGMNVSETRDMASVILDVKQQLGVTQILVEHDMAMVMGVADRVMVLDFGRVIARGCQRRSRPTPRSFAPIWARGPRDRTGRALRRTPPLTRWRARARTEHTNDVSHELRERRSTNRYDKPDTEG